MVCEIYASIFRSQSYLGAKIQIFQLYSSKNDRFLFLFEPIILTAGRCSH